MIERSRSPPGSGFFSDPALQNPSIDMDNINFPEHQDELQPEISAGKSVISFTLESISKVSVEIYNLRGDQCALIPATNFLPGDQQIHVNISNLGIPAGQYVYYLQIVNENGTSRECRMMSMH